MPTSPQRPARIRRAVHERALNYPDNQLAAPTSLNKPNQNLTKT